MFYSQKSYKNSYLKTIQASLIHCINALQQSIKVWLMFDSSIDMPFWIAQCYTEWGVKRDFKTEKIRMFLLFRWEFCYWMVPSKCVCAVLCRNVCTCICDYVVSTCVYVCSVQVFCLHWLQVKVMTDDELLGYACEQFLGKSVVEIKSVILQTLEGHLRSILGM